MRVHSAPAASEGRRAAHAAGMSPAAIGCGRSMLQAVVLTDIIEPNRRKLSLDAAGQVAYSTTT